MGYPALYILVYRKASTSVEPYSIASVYVSSRNDALRCLSSVCNTGTQAPYVC